MDDDERVERLLAAAREFVRRHDAATVAEMETLLAATPTHESGRPPMPGECHPYYQDRKWLMDWINGDSAYPSHCVRVPKPPPMRLMQPVHDYADLTAEVSAPQHFTLTKQQAAWPAPYVGRPFVYAWHFARDELGRSIAGVSHIVYLPGYGITAEEGQ